MGYFSKSRFLGISIILTGLVVLLTVIPGYSNEGECKTDSIASRIGQFRNIDFEDALQKVDLDLEILLSQYDTSCVVNLYVSYVNSTNGRSALFHLVFDDLWDALLLADQANLIEEKFRIYLELAAFFGYLDKYDQAEEYFAYASNILSEQSVNPQLLSKFYKAQSQYYNEKGEQVKAKLYLDSCYQVPGRDHLKKDYFLEYRRAAILRDEGNHVEAIEIFEDVILNLKPDVPEVLGIIYYNTGQSYAKLNKLKEAIGYYKLSIATFEKYGSHLDHLPKVHELLAEAFHAFGKNSEAYNHSIIASDLKKDTGNPSSIMSKHLMEVKDDFKDYKVQQKILSDQGKLDQLDQDKKVLRLQQVLLAGLVVFLTLISLLYFFYQKQKLRTEQDFNKTLSSRNDEINALLEDLERKNEDQIVFTNIMTHDLKAPLRSINSFSTLIKRYLESDNTELSKVSEFNDYVLGSSTLMVELIEDLLLYFKVGLDEKDFKILNLNEVLEIVLKSFSFDLNSNKLNLTIQDLPEIMGSVELLKTVFHNLISNGIKYQPKELDFHVPKIEIYSESDETFHFIYIEDNGIGIDEKFQTQMFDSFTKYHNKSEYSGSGLGLYISKEIMLKHNGSIELLRSSKNKTVFKLTFPRVGRVVK